ncbi:helix-turn-helix domain-containing protein [Nonomuraea sp. NPDC050783]|uniref:helix-turn-helix domain-containing protein n=1 Tax=Nonomuraea sp. NPDC050783 TaxID=3154634 RepID=UPI0034674C38
MEAPRLRTTTTEITDKDAIETFLSDTYGSDMRIRSEREDPFLRFSVADAGAFFLATLQQSAVLDFRIEPLNTVVVARMASARTHRTCGDCDQRYAGGDLFIGAYPGLPYTARLHPGEFSNCVIDPAELDKVAATAPGRRPEPIRFTSLDPVSPAAAAQWWQVQSYAADLLGNAGAATAPLVLAGMAQLLAAATLTTFPNTALTDPTIEDRHDASPATLRRAVAFIDEHAGQDISAADIAAAGRVSIRAVQLAFRRHLGTTPTGYLRRARLDHAHHALREADPGSTTVSAIAARFGFARHSRFTALYRSTYGVLPGDTLRGT